MRLRLRTAGSGDRTALGLISHPLSLRDTNPIETAEIPC